MMTVVLRRVTWTGVRRGLGGSRGWMIVAILAIGVRSLRRIAHSEPEVLYRTKVKPGDIFVLGAKNPD
jgi:hypothetical protein